jgi:hypothetical protein
MAIMKPVGSKRFRLTLWGGLIFALLYVILGCGGDDNNDDSGSTPPAVEEVVKVSGTPTVGGLRSLFIVPRRGCQ